MYSDKHFLAIIPARGGSKGIPRKNIVLLGGIPLIAHSIKSALRSRYLDKIIVSTDDDEIADISKQYGAEVLKRPPHLASDTAASIDMLLHACAEAGNKYDSVMLLQPTSPLRKTCHIDEAIELYASCGCKSLASVSLSEVSPLLVRKISADDTLIPILKNKSNVRRQDMEEYYKVNGAIYLNQISMINKNTILNNNEIGYVMNQKYSIDIDEPHDLFFAEKFYNLTE